MGTQIPAKNKNRGENLQDMDVSDIDSAAAWNTVVKNKKRKYKEENKQKKDEDKTKKDDSDSPLETRSQKSKKVRTKNTRNTKVEQEVLSNLYGESGSQYQLYCFIEDDESATVGNRFSELPLRLMDVYIQRILGIHSDYC